jgi:hypothetical protein
VRKFSVRTCDQSVDLEIEAEYFVVEPEEGNSLIFYNSLPGLCDLRVAQITGGQWASVREEKP